MSQQLANPPLGELVLARLREMIVTGELKPGQRLKENEIAEALVVSRGPVREAFAQLAGEGHVLLRRHRGAFVNALSDEDIDEVYSLRLAIEQLAADRARTRMGDSEFACLDAVLDEMKRVPADIDASEAVLLDLKFHDIIYDSADHQRVERVWASIRSHVSLFLHARNTYYPDFVAVGYAEHRALRDVLRDGDAEAVRRAVAEHISGAYERLKKLDLPGRAVGDDSRTCDVNLPAGEASMRLCGVSGHQERA